MRGCLSSAQLEHTAANLGRLRSTVAQRWSAYVSRWFPDCRLVGRGRGEGGGHSGNSRRRRKNERQECLRYFLCCLRDVSLHHCCPHVTYRYRDSVTGRHFYILVFPTCVHRCLLQTPLPNRSISLPLWSQLVTWKCRIKVAQDRSVCITSSVNSPNIICGTHCNNCRCCWWWWWWWRWRWRWC